VDLAYGPLFANLRNGVGVAFVDNDTVTLGASAVFLPGYRRRDVPAGIGRLSGGVGARLSATLRTGGFIAAIGGVQGISGGTEGVILDANLAYPIRLSSRFTLVPSLGATWANARHNSRYFGVSTAQALASGLPQFRPGAGLKDISATLALSFRLSEHISISAVGSLSSLLDEPADSPIVFHRTQPTGFMSASYRF
jgi:outer membrane protein